MKKQKSQTEITVYCHKVGEGNGTPLQYSCLENPMDGGAWWAAVHGAAKSQTRLSDFTFTFHFHVLEKEMATHSSILAWKIPWKEEAGRLQSMGSQRVGHNWVTSLSLSLWIRRETCSSNFISVQKYQVKCTSNNFKPKWVQDQFVLRLEMTVCTHWIGIHTQWA